MMNSYFKNQLKKLVFTYTTLEIVLLGVFLLSFYKLTREVLETETLYLDQAISLKIYNLRNPLLNQLFEFITQFGANFLVVLIFLICLLLIWKQKFIQLKLWIGSLGFIFVFNLLLKILVSRPRPILSQLISETDYSFPSGHSSASTVFYLMLIYLVTQNTQNPMVRFVIWVLGLNMILLISFSRVYLGVHYPTDVLAGIFEGVIIVISTINIGRILPSYQVSND